MNFVLKSPQKCFLFGASPVHACVYSKAGKGNPTPKNSFFHFSFIFLGGNLGVNLLLYLSARNPAMGGVNMNSTGTRALMAAASATVRPRLFMCRFRYG